MRKPLSDALWRCVNDALDARRSPWDDERVVDWLAEHPGDCAPLTRALERLDAASSARPRPPRARLAVAAGFLLAALLPLAARLVPTRGEESRAPIGSLTVHALEIQVDRTSPRASSLDPTGPFAYVDVRVETLTHRNPRR